MVTVCLNNGELLKLYQKKSYIENEMFLEEIAEDVHAGVKKKASTVDEGYLSRLQNKLKTRSVVSRALECAGFELTAEYCTSKLLQLNMKISKLKHKTYGACKVFVIFNTEAVQRKVLETMCVGTIPAMMDHTDAIDPKFLVKGNLLDIREAHEPSSVIYENLDVSAAALWRQWLLSWFILCCFLVAAYETIDVCFLKGNPVLGAFLISFWNVMLPTLNWFLVTNIENHHSHDDVEDSFIAKTIAARCFSSSIIIYIIGISNPSQLLSPYYIGSVQSVLFADAVTSPLLRVLVK
jgi:hypothetical protein